MFAMFYKGDINKWMNRLIETSVKYNLRYKELENHYLYGAIVYFCQVTPSITFIRIFLIC